MASGNVELETFAKGNSISDLGDVVEKPSWKERFSCFSKKEGKPRTLILTGDSPPNSNFPPNIIRNQKYSVFTFIPMTLYEQFKYFINFYYLVISLTQFIPALKVGYLFTYVAPLFLVVALSMLKEAYDDFKRMKRDKAVNSEEYDRLTPSGFKRIPASDIKVGYFIRVKANQRIPADMVLLRTTNETGASFIRTDQLDGETDWKLRRAVNVTQELDSDSDLFHCTAEIKADKPITDIYKFIGNLVVRNERGEQEHVEPLGLDQTLWSSTVLASDNIIGVVVYTGPETRSVINTRQPANKKGKLDVEVNIITIALCVLQLILAACLTAGGLFKGIWWLNFFRFVILLAGIIPISMRVNLDFAKLVYAFDVMRDTSIPGCTTRNTNIPEECGRISYLLSDKTGTLTQNDMIFKKLHLGQYNFNSESLPEIKELIKEHYEPKAVPKASFIRKGKMKELSASKQVYDIILASAVCHNVSITKTEDEDTGEITSAYQAASPDEVALVKLSESAGLTLKDRSLKIITIENPLGDLEKFEILECFPFSSERKRMGIIVKHQESGEIRFMMKGADVVMSKIVKESEWLDEECTNLAREGLRTLVFGHKIISDEEYKDFQSRLNNAQSQMVDREQCVDNVVESLEKDLELLGLTGVEDKLQEDVRQTLELLRCAGIKIWMLTGDKRETATCISISSKLVSRMQTIYQMDVSSESEARDVLVEFQQLIDTVLVIDGKSLEICLSGEEISTLFFESTCNAPSIVCCRCSPTQKAQVVELIRKLTPERVVSIGDGGNDVSMIQAAHVGVGIEGKEGRQAALAADYSITQFSHIAPLLLWHGRNSYQNSAMLSQVIVHRGMIMAFLQVIYSTVFYFTPATLYTGMLVFGYSCWYTFLPFFALVTDRDVSQEDALMYPELYQEIRKGRALSLKTFTIWILLSTFQAIVIFYPAILLMSYPMTYIDLVSVTFTALIFVLLIDVVFCIKTWNILLSLSLISTVAIYPICMLILPSYYHIQYIASWTFWWKTCTITFAATFPVFFIKKCVDIIHPRTTSKI